jgi:hypothetical protein
MYFTEIHLVSRDQLRTMMVLLYLMTDEKALLRTDSDVTMALSCRSRPAVNSLPSPVCRMTLTRSSLSAHLSPVRMSWST